jgi:hypothetical protein
MWFALHSTAYNLFLVETRRIGMGVHLYHFRLNWLKSPYTRSSSKLCHILEREFSMLITFNNILWYCIGQFTALLMMLMLFIMYKIGEEKGNKHEM